MPPSFLLIIAVVMLACILLNIVSSKIGVPTLLAFMLLGILFANNGIWAVRFDDYEIAKETCTVALIFLEFPIGSTDVTPCSGTELDGFILGIESDQCFGLETQTAVVLATPEIRTYEVSSGFVSKLHFCFCRQNYSHHCGC